MEEIKEENGELGSYGRIVTHDLQDCLDDNFDLFNNVYEQIPVINYSKYVDEKDKPENATYLDKFSDEENAG